MDVAGTLRKGEKLKPKGRGKRIMAEAQNDMRGNREQKRAIKIERSDMKEESLA